MLSLNQLALAVFAAFSVEASRVGSKQATRTETQGLSTTVSENAKRGLTSHSSTPVPTETDDYYDDSTTTEGDDYADGAGGASETTSPYPSPANTYSPYPTSETYSPYPTPYGDNCYGKPLLVEVDVGGTDFTFCCFNVTSAFHFNDCALTPPMGGAQGPMPTLAPYAPPPTTPGPPGPGYPSSMVKIHLALKTDQFPDQTSFSLQDAHTQELLWDVKFTDEKWEPFSKYHYEIEVDPQGCYYFIMYDAFGDGLSAGYGSFELYFADYLFWYGTMFGYYSSVAVGSGCGYYR